MEEQRFQNLIQELQVGLKAEKRGEIAEALSIFERILDDSRASMYPEGIALSALEIGMLVRPKDPHQAIQLYEECLQATQRATRNMDQIASNALHNMGTASMQLRKLEQAEYYLRESISIKRRLNNELDLADALNNLVVSLIGQGNWDDAYSYGVEALEIHSKYKNDYGSARVMANLGTICKHLGKKKDAIIYYEQALELLSRLKAPEAPNVQAALIALHSEMR